MNLFQNDIQRIKAIKKMFFDVAYKNQIGHLPSALSALEIMYVLYNKIANITAQNAGDKVRDRVIISKEHCRFAQLCVLVEKGLVSRDVLDTYLKNGAMCGHDMYNIVGEPEIAAIDVSSGSLGHGLGVGIGLALAAPQQHIYVIVGDGELQEGSCWEALMFIGHNQVKNLTVIVDRNNQQIDNFTKNIVNSSAFAPKAIEAFGFEVKECHGHSIGELTQVLQEKTDKPKCLIANTIKGKEILPMLDRFGFALFHWGPLTENDYKKALAEVENATA